MNKLVLESKKWNWPIIATVFFWVLVWFGYDTGIDRFSDPNWSHGVLNIIHSIRAFVPIIAALSVIVILAVQKWRLPQGFFFTPLGLLELYAIVGFFSSAFSNRMVFALYWALMFGAVITVLLIALRHDNALEHLRWIIKLNWIIAGIITLALLALFLLQPGAYSSLTLNFLVCMKRPFEGLGNNISGVSQFGLAASRPTGFGRYAAIAAIIAFVTFLYAQKKKKLLPFLLFFIFAGITFFSKGKTEVGAFLIAIFALIMLSRRYTLSMIALYAVMLVTGFTIIFFNIPCTSSDAILSFLAGPQHNLVVPRETLTPHAIENLPHNLVLNLLSDSPPTSAPTPTPVPASAPTPALAQQDPSDNATTTEAKSIASILTLSGRTNGVWRDALDLLLGSMMVGRGFQADRYFLSGQHAHNTLIHALIQTGILGTIPFVCALLITLFFLFKLLKNPKIEGSQRIFLLGVAGVLAFLFLRGVTESLAFYSADWLFAAPLVAYIQVLYYRYQPVQEPHKKRIIITSGYFNPVHSGHINLIREAKALGDELVVIVNSDAQAKLKGSIPFMPEHERLEIIKSLKPVDHAMLAVDSTRDVGKSLRAVGQQFPGAKLFFAKGGDRNSGNIPEEEIKACLDFDIQIINNVGGGKVQSSSWLIENVVNAFFQIKKMSVSPDDRNHSPISFSSIRVLGNKIDMVQIPQVIDLMDYWIAHEHEKSHWIVATGMHGVVEAQKNPEFKQIVSKADLWAPDGISLVWMAKLNGFNLKKRVAGPDLFHEFLIHSAKKGYKHYFYGDTDQTLQTLEKKLTKELSNIKVESFSPPFRSLTPEEDAVIIKKINDAKPDVLWVGLGLPKQERWIFEHKDKLQVPVIIGVGAAFKFEAGLVRRAPAWVGNRGFEWLWRLVTEPRVVWRRVFIDAPQFIWLASSDFIKNRHGK
jgi:N-acetylglucosaminyldiphosphoundecaprenol N-acetyl-beta-D-mannosaminyltransferase